MPREDTVITIDEAATILDCSRDMVEWMIKHDRLQVIRVPTPRGKVRPKPMLLKSVVETMAADGWRRGTRKITPGEE
jgi:hypothetical protein